MTAVSAGPRAILLAGQRGLLSGLLALLALLTYLPGFASLPPTDRDEARFVQASRQMLETGDLVDIRFQDEPRYKKPIGIYWLQAAAVSLAGRPLDSIWPYRLPSLLAALIALGLVLRLGERLFEPTGAGRQIGVVAALLLGASLLLGVEARLAKTDATLLAASLAAFDALAACHGGRTGRWTWLQFWLALSLGILVKGPVLPLFAIATVGCLAAIERRLAWLAALRPLPGLALAVVIVAPWLVAIGLASHGGFFRASLGHDFAAKLVGGEESHGQPPGFYLAAIAVTFWPGGLLAAAALPGIWQRRREPAMRFLLAWLLPAWILLELIPTKLPHYVLPLYPALALLTAAVFADRTRPLAAGWPRWLVGAGIALWLAVGLGLPLGLGAARWWLGGGLDPLAPLTALAVAAAMLAALHLFARQRREGGLVALLAAGLALQVGGFGLLLPGFDQVWLARQAARLVAARSPCAQPIVSGVGYQEPSLVFLLGTRTRLVDAAVAARDLVEARGKACRLALIPDEAEPTFQAALAGAAPTSLGQVAGINYSNGHRQRLTLYALP
jgi:4-amino-4-deoxy-L-arabinose transferase-like glycosyltransferase